MVSRSVMKRGNEQNYTGIQLILVTVLVYKMFSNFLKSELIIKTVDIS